MNAVCEVKPVERRMAPRRRVEKGAHVVYNNGHSLLDCTVEDLSLTGARIKLSSPFVLPETFAIRFSDGRICQAELVWRRANRAGLRFAETVGDAQNARNQNGVLKQMLVERLKEIESQLADLRREIEVCLGG